MMSKAAHRKPYSGESQYPEKVPFARHGNFEFLHGDRGWHLRQRYVVELLANNNATIDHVNATQAFEQEWIERHGRTTIHIEELEDWDLAPYHPPLRTHVGEWMDEEDDTWSLMPAIDLDEWVVELAFHVSGGCRECSGHVQQRTDPSNPRRRVGTPLREIHGTYNCYLAGCRCEDCKAGWREYQQKRKERASNGNTGTP